MPPLFDRVAGRPVPGPTGDPGRTRADQGARSPTGPLTGASVPEAGRTRNGPDSALERDGAAGLARLLLRVGDAVHLVHEGAGAPARPHHPVPGLNPARSGSDRRSRSDPGGPEKVAQEWAYTSGQLQLPTPPAIDRGTLKPLPVTGASVPEALTGSGLRVPRSIAGGVGSCSWPLV
jgi:hypothetical protein